MWYQRRVCCGAGQDITGGSPVDGAPRRAPTVAGGVGRVREHLRSDINGARQPGLKKQNSTKFRAYRFVRSRAMTSLQHDSSLSTHFFVSGALKRHSLRASLLSWFLYCSVRLIARQWAGGGCFIGRLVPTTELTYASDLLGCWYKESQKWFNVADVRLFVGMHRG